MVIAHRPKKLVLTTTHISRLLFTTTFNKHTHRALSIDNNTTIFNLALGIWLYLAKVAVSCSYSSLLNAYSFLNKH